MVTAIFREFNESSSKLLYTVAKSTRNYPLEWDYNFFAFPNHILQFTVWKLRNFTATSQKFCENNFLLKNFTLNWFDEKNCCVHIAMWNFRNLLSLTPFWQKFRESNSFPQNFILNWFDEKNFALRGSKLFIFPQCSVSY